MRGYIPEFEMKRPESLKEAVAELATPGAWTPIAGGTDLMVLLEAGQLRAKRLLDITRLAELRGIDVTDEFVTLGALSTYTDVQRHKLLQREFPNLCLAGFETGGIAIQNRGTIGGNIANASPAADTPPALLTYDAELVLISQRGERWVKYEDFHKGYKQTALASDELIKAIRIPRSHTPRDHYYRKVGTRRAQAISKVVLAGVIERRASTIERVRIAIGSVAPRTLRLHGVERVLVGKALSPGVRALALEALAAEIAPIDDIRSTKDYRLKVSQNLLGSLLDGLR